MKRRIPLPWKNEPTQADIRSEATKAYWSLMKSWNIGSSSMTIKDAIDTCRNIQQNLTPHCALAAKVQELQSDIVMHGTKSRKAKQSTPIRQTKMYVM